MLSSSRVFNGNKETPYIETDEPDPIDDYGQSKYLGELMVRSLNWNVPYYIFRLPIVLGGRERNRDAQVVTRLIDQAKQGMIVKAACDVFHSPVHAETAVSAMMDCLRSDMMEGIYHLGRGDSMTLYDLMAKVIKELGMKSGVMPVAASVIDPIHRFPVFQSLSSLSMKVGSTLSNDIGLFVSEERRRMAG
jgi:dTDP-4-dehydrorhamnose reductase